MSFWEYLGYQVPIGIVVGIAGPIITALASAVVFQTNRITVLNERQEKRYDALIARELRRLDRDDGDGEHWQRPSAIPRALPAPEDSPTDSGSGREVGQARLPDRDSDRRGAAAGG